MTRPGRATPQPLPLPATPPTASLSNSRWDVFRRLCRYYAEFVRLEERASVRVYASKEQQDFIQIASAVDWTSLEAGRPVTIQLTPESGVFVRRGLSGNKLPYWFLGLPVDVIRGKDEATGEHWISLEPILVAAVHPEVADNLTLTLHPLAPLEVNPGWLQRRFKRADQRLQFLATVGLEEAADATLEGREDVSLPLASFRTAIDALRIAYKEWWREFPSLDRLQTSPALDRLTENGLHNRAILVSQPRLKYASRLFEELLKLADPSEISDQELDRTALAVLFPHDPPPSAGELHSSAANPSHAAEYQLLNEEQRRAVQAALTHRLTVLTGPPGTGKSVTVAHVMANMAMAHRSVLFASRNHQAIEAVEPRLNAIVEPETLVMRPTRPWGQDARTADWQKALVGLLTKPRNPEATVQLMEAHQRLTQSLDSRSEIERDMNRLLELGDELARRESSAQESTAKVPASHASLVAAGAHLPSPSDLESLIVAIQTHDVAPRGRIRRLIFSTIRLLQLALRIDPAKGLRLRLGTLDERIREATCGQLRLGALDNANRGPLLEAVRIAKALSEACNAQRGLAECQREIAHLADRKSLDAKLDRVTEQLHEDTKTVLRHAAEVSGTDLDLETRQRFAELRAGIQNHQGSSSLPRFEKAFAESLPDLLRHYPLWAVSNLSAYKAMPLAAGVADLLIIDEASQCDIPSVVPLLFRARRALIVGDPMQLGHITTLSRAAELRIRQVCGLVGPQQLERFSVGVNSVYDLAANSVNREAMIQLRAHYRCHPQIASYCNRAFYGGTLRVMTNVGRLKAVPGLGTARAASWTDVQGEVVSATSGCHNPAEVTAVLQQVQALLEAGFEGTVGVVTPFRVQANRVQDAAASRFTTEQINRMQFLAHTVDGFQGDERDVIFFSLVAGPGMPEGSRGFLASAPNRFNVAISRGRSCVRVIGNREWATSCGIPHITALLRVCEGADSAYIPRPELIGPVWEPRLAEALRAAGVSFHQQYPTCGYYLDFALVGENFRLDVEVDGETWHRGSDGKRLVDDLYRDHVLRAAGWNVLRFWVYQLKEDLDGCVRTICSAWNRGTRGG